MLTHIFLRSLSCVLILKAVLLMKPNVLLRKVVVDIFILLGGHTSHIEQWW